VSKEKSTRVKFNNFVLELNPSFAEFSFVYRCVTGQNLTKDIGLCDKWMLRSLDGHGFGYILAINDYEYQELELFDVGIYDRFRLNPILKSIKTLVSGRVYNNDQTVMAFTDQKWFIEHVIKKAGFELFEPDEPWSIDNAKYYIHELHRSSCE